MQFGNTAENNKITKSDLIFKENITNTNFLSDIIINIILFLGSFGFLLVGISSFYKFDLLPMLDAKEIIFFPQGATMSFYGTSGIIVSIYQFLILYWKIGEGYNEFNKKLGTATIFRKGFPGEYAEIKITYPLEDILRNIYIVN